MNDLLSILKRREIQAILFSCIFIWLCVAGGSIYLLPRINTNLLQNSYPTGIYFLIFALISGYYYKVYEFFPHHVGYKKQLIPIITLTVFLVSFTVYFNHVFPMTPEIQQKIAQSKFFFPLFRLDTFLAKLGDITFQQVVIYGVLKRFKENGLTNKQAMGLFTIGFFLIHVPLVFSLKWYAFFFIVPSLVAGGIFSYLILYWRYGLFKSYATHLLFYLAIGLYFRL
jgi:hypothetical protein